MSRWSKRSLLFFAVLALTILIGVAPAFAAETVHLTLKIEGAVVAGDSTQQSLGRANTIECISVEQAIVWNEKEKVYDGFKCVKRIDKTTPLLIRALAEHKPVEGTFKFYRPSPSGDGTTQQFYTIELKDAFISSYRMWVPSTIDPATSNQPPLEEIVFTFRTVTWIYTDGNVNYSDRNARLR